MSLVEHSSASSRISSPHRPRRRAWSRLVRRQLLGAAGLLITAAVLAAQTPIMPLDQVKPGLLGKGRSVFQGNRVEEFEAEILGVLSNVLPKRSIILARLKGQGLENSGIIQGMSGSPVYVEGKLVGAVAYGFSYSKEPIAGLTPIEEMLALSSEPSTAPASFAARNLPPGKINLEEYTTHFADVFSPRPFLEAEGRSLRPIGVPVLCRGLSVRAVEKYRPALARMGFLPVGAGQSVVQSPEASLASATLQGGDSVAVQLIGGDLDMSALGTVTHVDGRKVYAFGHPLYNLGSVEYAMAKAEVLTVIPSLESSFKLAVPRSLVGTFVQDRSSGSYGELGRRPSLMPVNLKLSGGPFGAREYRLQVVNDRILGPFFTSMAVGLVLRDAERALGDLTLELRGDVYLQNGQSVHLEDLFSGNFDASAGDLANLVLAVTYFLMNNEFEGLGIFRVDLEVQASERAMTSQLEKVVLDKYEAAPGEAIGVKVFLRTYRGETSLQEVQIPAPNLPAGAAFQVVIGDAASIQALETAQFGKAEFVPRNLNQLVRLLNNLRKNNRVYIKVLAARPGLFLRGEELSNLPPTIKALFSSPRAAGSRAQATILSTLAEYQLPVPVVFNGLARIPLSIKK